jgi:RNA-binding protein NOB1
VIDEIRDSKARSHLESLPFELQVREPTAEGLAQIVEFSKKTGDYSSLSAVDIRILALLYDLEKEGCNTMSHIRKDPKRPLTGKIVPMVQVDDANKNASNLFDEEQGNFNNEKESNQSLAKGNGENFFQGPVEVHGDNDDEMDDTYDLEDEDKTQRNQVNNSKSNKSWVQVLTVSAPQSNVELNDIQDVSVEAKLESMNLENGVGGQFSDAEDDESLHFTSNVCDSSDDGGDEFASIGEDFSDEECDVYILDPEEVEEKKRKELHECQLATEETIASELEMEFPSLLAASTVPYEGSDDDEVKDKVGSAENLRRAAEEEERRRNASLKPISNSGKLYNSFRGYKDIVKMGGANIQPKKKQSTKIEQMAKEDSPDLQENSAVDELNRKYNSRVIGGAGISGQSAEVEDDGEGWVTSTSEIIAMKATGTLDPFGRNHSKTQNIVQKKNLPPKPHRAACATTDFAMQNVILQMNLELLSVDGVKVRKLKSWVTRCAACFKIYTGSENDGKRLFCERCGSSALQRIAASLDGDTGRLKLHLKKNYKSKTRGTQFALPQPGKQNRFMGDLLLAEDQLLYGAWNQRVKRTSSKKEKLSIFGADIASNVGCHKDLTKRDDIMVGFGRKNPNATKFGRERRGKKKVSTEKACGLRRY